jgi:hypothetical protein
MAFMVRRMFRRLFYVAAILSALSLLCALVLWPLSHRLWRTITYSSGGDHYTFYASSGRISCQIRRAMGVGPEVMGIHLYTMEPYPNGFDLPWSYFTWRSRRNALFAEWECLGLRWEHADAYLDSHERMTVTVPFSYVCILLAVLPVVAFFSRRRRRRLSARRAFPVEPTSNPK